MMSSHSQSSITKNVSILSWTEPSKPIELMEAIPDVFGFQPSQPALEGWELNSRTSGGILNNKTQLSCDPLEGSSAWLAQPPVPNCYCEETHKQGTTADVFIFLFLLSLAFVIASLNMGAPFIYNSNWICSLCINKLRFFWSARNKLLPWLHQSKATGFWCKRCVVFVSCQRHRSPD